ncbi:hypothetical protein OE88DRAFT_1607356, partial [Heliocybe sulcata]
CEAFQEEWNHHPISGDEHDQVPLDMWFVGQMEHGVYAEDYEDVHPDILNHYYGIDSATEVRYAGQTGAGHSETEEDGEDFDDLIATDQEHHIRHDPIPVPRATSPFSEDVTADFLSALDEVLATDFIPAGLNVREQEWPVDGYP